MSYDSPDLRAPGQGEEEGGAQATLFECPKCSNVTFDPAELCPLCGTRLVRTIATLHCPYCGRTLFRRLDRKNILFCRVDGAIGDADAVRSPSPRSKHRRA